MCHLAIDGVGRGHANLEPTPGKRGTHAGLRGQQHAVFIEAGSAMLEGKGKVLPAIQAHRSIGELVRGQPCRYISAYINGSGLGGMEGKGSPAIGSRQLLV